MTHTRKALAEFVSKTKRAGWHQFLADLHEEDFTHDLHDPYLFYRLGGLLDEASKVIVSNMPEEGLKKIPTKGHTAKSWTHASYKQDFTEKVKRKAEEKKEALSPDEVDARAHKMADHSVEKQTRAHSRLTGIVGRMLPDKAPEGRPQGHNVVGIGSGMGHEQAEGIKHKDLAKKPHTQTGHDFLKPLIDSANHRNKGMGVTNASNHEWSAYHVGDKGAEHPEGSKDRADAQIAEVGKLQNMPASKAHHDHEERTQKGMDGLPHGEHNIGYAKHACGGITDTGIKKAVQHGYHGFVANTCCSHRLTGVSHEVIAKHHGIKWKDWQKLVKTSGELGSSKRSGEGDKRTDAEIREDYAHDRKRSRKAQLAIDHYRKGVLEHHGYTVHQGWANGKDGKPEPKGGILAAAKKGAPLHPHAHDRDHVFKGVDMHDHHGELGGALADHAKGDFGHGKSAADTRKANEKAASQQAKGPKPLINGGHLKAMGIGAGPRMGKILGHVKKLQASGHVTDHAGALAAAKAHHETLPQEESVFLSRTRLLIGF